MHKERSESLGSKPTNSLVTTERTTTQIEPDTESEMAGGCESIDSLEDARKSARDLRQKTRAQAQQILAWRRAYKMQELYIARLQREKCEQLKALSSKLLLFESRLIRKQKDISTMLNVRENIIHRQQRLIETLTNRLIDNGLEVPQNELNELETNLPDLDSLNDSDSAVVMEDIDSDSSNLFNIPRFRSHSTDGGITVVRSISDAIDPNLKYTSIIRRNNGFLRRPEILETVYSVEEDGDNDNNNHHQTNNNDSKSEANKKRESFATRGKAINNIDENDVQKDRSLDEKICNETTWTYRHDHNKSTNLDVEQPDSLLENKTTNQVKTYNRVMSNHRSVTKPKDVKYKRINKAKSKSLEELRGRLKCWVEQGSKLTGIALEHSQSYA